MCRNRKEQSIRLNHPELKQDRVGATKGGLQTLPKKATSAEKKESASALAAKSKDTSLRRRAEQRESVERLGFQGGTREPLQLNR